MSSIFIHTHYIIYCLKTEESDTRPPPKQYSDTALWWLVGELQGAEL